MEINREALDRQLILISSTQNFDYILLLRCLSTALAERSVRHTALLIKRQPRTLHVKQLCNRFWNSTAHVKPYSWHHHSKTQLQLQHKPMPPIDYGITEHIYPSRPEDFIHLSSPTVEANVLYGGNTLMGLIEGQPPRHCSAPPPPPEALSHIRACPMFPPPKRGGKTPLSLLTPALDATKSHG